MKLSNKKVTWPSVLKFITHGKPVLKIAVELGWRPGARYTNLRDIRGLCFKGVGFLDIDWKNYSFSKHLAAARETLPFITVARDVESMLDLALILREAEELNRYARFVVIVPKDPTLAPKINEYIPPNYILGYSVPTKYGKTPISPEFFTRPVHLLGGRPDTQRKLASQMHVISIDCNRFTLDARYGDYFDGEIFRPHPKGGYRNCLKDSIYNIEKLWKDYHPIPHLIPFQT
jgi:hypothetical protein